MDLNKLFRFVRKYNYHQIIEFRKILNYHTIPLYQKLIDKGIKRAFNTYFFHKDFLYALNNTFFWSE